MLMKVEELRETVRTASRKGQLLRGVIHDSSDWKEAVGMIMKLNATGRLELDERTATTLATIKTHGKSDNRWLARTSEDAERNRTIRFRFRDPDQMEAFLDFCQNHLVELQVEEPARGSSR